MDGVPNVQELEDYQLCRAVNILIDRDGKNTALPSVENPSVDLAKLCMTEIYRRLDLRKYGPSDS